MPSLDLLPELDYNVLDQNFRQLDKQFNDGLSLDSLSINVDDPLGNDINDEIPDGDFRQKEEEDLKIDDIQDIKLKKIVREYEENPILLNGEAIGNILKECNGSSLKDKRKVRQILLGSI